MPSLRSTCKSLPVIALGLGLMLSSCQDDPPEVRPVASSATPPPAAAPAWTQVVPDDPSARTCRIALGPDRQVFHGFGTSFLDCNGWGATTPLPIHRQLAAQTWGAGGLTILRTWLYLPETMPADGTIDIGPWVRRYLDSHLVGEALAAGCTGVVMAPAQFPRQLRLAAAEAVEPVVNGHHEQRMASDAGIVAMMDGTAEAILRIRRDHGIPVIATGIQNEPNQDHGDSGYITIAQTPLAVKSLRAALDRRGLQAVTIIAPETSSVDWTFSERIAALRADPEAWAALGAAAWHSYNMAMVPGPAQELRAAGKELWMTEASANGPEASNDRVAAASMAARIANDLRCGAGRWIWFLGYEGHDPNDNQTRLMRIFQERTPVTWEALGKFHPLKDLCAAIPPGSTVLDTSGDAIGAWTYGRKPALQAVAARRPDGRIAIAAVNFTAPNFPAAGASGGFEIENAGLPAETLRLDLHLPIASGSAAVRRRDTDLATPIDELLPVRDGRLSLVLRPLEIVTVVVTP